MSSRAVTDLTVELKAGQTRNLSVYVSVSVLINNHYAEPGYLLFYTGHELKGSYTRGDQEVCGK